ncbi:non-heme iron oxygenase ferredoxin subunit [Serinicoccus chungangensis]|uniref:non-heme iron oxygenase ferredoxin subunit n=1 Tax=Serinicoccus chungangensis TaxID=767452 RepID=UPI0030B80F13
MWENEGGLLATPLRLPAVDDAAGQAPRPWSATVALAGLPAEGAIRLVVRDVTLCIARSQGAVYALLDECSHGRVALSAGDVAGGLVECWLHGSCFDLATGIPTGPPATTPVPVYPVRIVDGVVEVALP